MIINDIFSFLTKPVQMWMQRFGYIEPRFSKSEITRMLGIIKAGDVLGSYETGRITGYFIKGEYDHVGIVDAGLHVIEAVGDILIREKKVTLIYLIKRFFNKVPKIKVQNLGGVRRIPLEDWLWRKNEIFISRHKNFQVANRAATESNTFMGKDYDYGFKEGDDKYSCTELVKECFRIGQPNYMAKNRVPLPIDFLKQADMIVIYNSMKEKTK